MIDASSMHEDDTRQAPEPDVAGATPDADVIVINLTLDAKLVAWLKECAGDRPIEEQIRTMLEVDHDIEHGIEVFDPFEEDEADEGDVALTEEDADYWIRHYGQRYTH